MKKIKLLVFFVIITGALSSCQREEIRNENPQEALVKPTKAQLEKLSSMHINTDNVAIEDVTFLDGTKEKYLVSQDILVLVSDIDKYKISKGSKDHQKQFQFRNIVAPPFRNINILGYTGDNFALTSKMHTALSWAVNNYNVLPNTINFTLAKGTDTEWADIIVFRVDEDKAGGFSTLPNPVGQPGRFIGIRAGMNIHDINASEHILTHMIGHALGLVHQDWKGPCSGGPPAPGYSPLLIPGTPSSPYADSIMQSCFTLETDGELTATDKDALNILYE